MPHESSDVETGVRLGQELRELHSALMDACPREPYLEYMVRLRLGQHLQRIAGGQNLGEVTFNLITWAEANDRLDDLRAIATESHGLFVEGPFSVPHPRNPLFVGRDSELAQLSTIFDNPRCIVISGTGGLGKTQLAVEYAYHARASYPGGVFWITMDPVGGIEAQVAVLAGPAYLSLPGYVPEQFAQNVTLVRSAWREPIPRLLIFDNLDDARLLRKWLPEIGGCRVLVTSRRAQWDAALGLFSLPVEVLSRAESVRLLRKHHSDLPLEDTDLALIAAELGDLPLALHLAGHFLSRYRAAITPAAYLAQLRSAPLLRHRSLRDGDLSPTDHDPHVERTFYLSYRQLDSTDSVDRVGLAFLARAAYFAPGEPIPANLLRATQVDSTADPFILYEAEDGLARISSLGLIEILPGSFFRLHRLLATFVRTVSRDGTAQSAVEDALLTYISQLNESGYPLQALAAQPHLRFVVDNALSRNDDKSVSLAHVLSHHLILVGDYAGAYPYTHYAFSTTEQLYGPDDAHTGTALNNLAELIRGQGKLTSAYSLMARALAITEKSFGPDHSETATVLHNLGSILYEQGKVEEAKALLERAFALREHLFGPTHSDIAVSLTAVARILKDQGDLTAALSLLQRALTITEQIYGPNHPKTAASLNNLGQLLHQMGDFSTARPLLQRGLAIMEEELGPTHPHIPSLLSNLGSLLKSQGDLAGARTVLERAVEINTQHRGLNDADTALSLSNLAAVLDAQGDLPNALLLSQRALVLMQQTLGPLHPLTLRLLTNLGAIFQAQGNLKAAYPLLEYSVYASELILGSMHPDNAISLSAMADLLIKQRKLTAARPLLERALAITEQALGLNHPTVATRLNNLALLLKTSGDLSAARSLYERTLGIDELAYGPDHFEVAQDLNHLASLLQDQGDLVTARKYYERALDIAGKTVGRNTPFMASLVNNLGSLLYTLGDLPAARGYLEQAIAIAEQTYGPKHPLTRQFRRTLKSF